MARRRRVLLMVETSLSFGREVLRGINRYVVTHEPWSMYLDLRELLVEPPRWLDQWDGDGIISRTTTPDLAQRLAQRRLPAVDLTDVYGDSGLPHIWIDHVAVGRLAASHLVERGFRHFAFCGFSDHHWSRLRRDGFLAGVGDTGSCAVWESDWNSQGLISWEGQQRQLADWLRKLPRPVGILASNDLRGQHVLDACRRLDLAVPEEVAVIGVDNDELLCAMCDPPLSSVVLHAQRVGYEAARMLDRLMSRQKLDTREILVEPAGIVVRQSTDMLAIDDPDVVAAVRHIRDHACEGLTVSELLRHVRVPRSVLERRFRKYLKRSPQEEIRLVRLKRVRQLLEETDLSLETIADRAGFRHAEYMNVAFKRATGQTPGQYRRTVRG